MLPYDDYYDAIHFDTPEKTPSNDTISPVSEDDLLGRLRTDMRSDSAIRCFGGTLFRSIGSFDTPVAVFAVPCSDKEALKAQAKWYHECNLNREMPFLVYDNYYKSDDVYFFTFHLPEGIVSVREKLRNPAFSENGPAVFARLIRFLKMYSDHEHKYAHEYRPLCSLCLDTVFIEEYGNQTHLRILPLRAVGNDYPLHYPDEIRLGKADISSDMYTAALIGLQVLSGTETESDEIKMDTCEALPCMNDCLFLFPSRRPGLHTVLEELRNASPDTQEIDSSEGYRKVREPNISVALPPFSDFFKSFKNPFRKRDSIFAKLMKLLGLEVEQVKEPTASKIDTLTHIQPRSSRPPEKKPGN